MFILTLYFVFLVTLYVSVREQLSRGAVLSFYRLGSRDQIWVTRWAHQDPVCAHICNTMLLWLTAVTKAWGRIVSWCLTFA